MDDEKIDDLDVVPRRVYEYDAGVTFKLEEGRYLPSNPYDSPNSSNFLNPKPFSRGV